MDRYDIQDAYEGTHTVQVTLQDGLYKGRIVRKVSGNCFGATHLNNPFETDGQDDIDMYGHNDCNLEFDDELEVYTGVLHDADGKGVYFSWDEMEISDHIVAVEIIGFTPK